MKDVKSFIEREIEQIRELRAFDSKAYGEALYNRAIEVYRAGNQTDITLRASRIAEIEGRKFTDVLKDLVDEKVADKVQRQAGKQDPLIYDVESQREAILSAAEFALKRAHLVWQQGRKYSGVKDEFSDIIQALAVMEVLGAINHFPDEVSIYTLRIGIGNSIYVREEQ